MIVSAALHSVEHTNSCNVMRGTAVSSEVEWRHVRDGGAASGAARKHYNRSL